MISTPGITKRSIKSHYDLATPFYRLLWGPHIHHGLWDDERAMGRSPRAAQLHLTDTLADLARVAPGNRVLDVGCGMGGSSIHLAKSRGCRVTGVTLSGVQRRWAATSGWWQGVSRSVEFRRADIEAESFPAASFDVVWSIECTEHLTDKRAFFARAAAWLRPGGRMAICAWLAAEDADLPAKRSQVEKVCEAFLCPSLGSFSDYSCWMESAGLVVDVADDWTSRVARTWELCEDRVRAWGIDRVAPWIDPAQSLFIEHFSTLLNAYRSGAMQYGCLIAHRPPDTPS